MSITRPTEPATGAATPARLRDHRAALAGYAVLTAVVLWPAVRWFASRPMIGSGDSSVFYWSWWAMPRAVIDGNDPYSTTMLFHPVGVDLSLTTTATLLGFATYPIRAVFGPVVQVNVIQLLSFWLAAVGTYLLADRVARHRGAAFVAGAAFACAPFRFHHLADHLNLINTAFLPFGVLALLRLLDAPSRRRAIALGAVLGAAFLTDPQIALLTACCLVPVLVAERAQVRRELGSFVQAAVTTLVVASPALVPLGLAMLDGESSRLDPRLMTVYASDPLRWFIPPISHPVVGGLAESVGGRPPGEGVAYPGLLLVVLAFVGARARDIATTGRWVALALIGAVLALGPYPRVGDKVLDIPLPFRFLVALPGFDSLRVPGRFVIVGVLAVNVLAAVGLAALVRRHPERSRVLVLGALAVTLFELWPGTITHRAEVIPEPYEAIADDPHDGAVLELPLQWSTGEGLIGDTEVIERGRPRNDSIFMVYATVHERPLVGGSVSRYSDDRLDELLAIPEYRQLLALEGSEGFDDRAEFTRRDLEDLGIDFVVYHRDRPIPALLRYVEALELPVLADDGTVVVWLVAS